MKNIILFGAPGSGKGTQGEILAQKYGLVQVSTGELLRKEINENSQIGMEIKDLLSTGKMVNDEFIFKLIENLITANTQSNGFIFDGVPRNISQMERLEKIFAEKNLEISHVIVLNVPDEELVTRITKRGKQNNRIDDQNEIIVKMRIKIYHSETASISKFYTKKNKLFQVNGLDEVAKISENIIAILENN